MLCLCGQLSTATCHAHSAPQTDLLTCLLQVSFFTAGPMEARAWRTRRGSDAARAAGVIHTDIGKNLVRAEVVEHAVLVAEGGWKGAKEKGLVRTEGKDYVVQDGDVCLFLNSK